MSRAKLHFAVPGPLDQLTGGYVYDGHMVAGLRQLGWEVQVHDLAGSFPDPDAEARASLSAMLGSLTDGTAIVIDGLAMGGAPEPLEEHGHRLRIVSMLHHPLAEETGISPAESARFRESERRALVPCAGVIVSSPFTMETIGTYGVSPERVRVVLPGTERVPPAEGPPPGAPPLLLSVASLTPRKGYDVLVAALAGVADLEWTCMCAGSADRDPAHARSVLSAVAEHGLESRITFVGERLGQGLGELYRGASAFVLASHYEGYGMALADALAHGLPVVSTTGGAIPFTVPHTAGLLVAPGDPVAFSGALRKLLADDPSVRDRLAAAARRHAAGLPTWADSITAFAEAVTELTS